VILKERIHDPRDPHYHLDHIYCARLSCSEAEAAAALADAREVRFVGEDELAALPMFANFRALVARVFADRALWSQLQAEPAAPGRGEAGHVEADLRS
jgi:glyoxylase-like metal-dependent hydrolase (beta-lactamase superfamily II)